MRIGYFGDGRWAHGALERIVALPGMEIVFIAARYSAPDPVLRQWADKLHIPFLVSPNVNEKSFIDTVIDLSPDMNVSMSFDQVLRQPIIDSAPMGFINCHAGALPFYRGRNVLNWAIINGEDHFGVTVHYIDEGIDTGDIIAQRSVPITQEDTYASVLEKAAVACSELLSQAVQDLAEGRASRMPQKSIHPVGFYCGRRIEGDEAIDWSKPTKEVHNLIRALVPPGPCARTIHQGKVIGVVAAQTIPDAPPYIDIPGRVVGRDEFGVIVKTGDTTIRITKIVFIEKDGNCSQELVPAFAIGTRIGHKDHDERIGELELRIRKLERILYKSS